MAPTWLERIVIDFDIEMLSRDAAAAGAADLHGLVGLAIRNTAADVENDGAQRGAHR